MNTTETYIQTYKRARRHTSIFLVLAHALRLHSGAYASALYQAMGTMRDVNGKNATNRRIPLVIPDAPSAQCASANRGPCWPWLRETQAGKDPCRLGYYKTPSKSWSVPCRCRYPVIAPRRPPNPNRTRPQSLFKSQRDVRCTFARWTHNAHAVISRPADEVARKLSRISRQLICTVDA